MISFSNVFKRYPGEMDALQDINIEISTGELVFVTGPSGAGKSTLLKLISAIEKPTSGSIIFENLNLAELKNKDMPFLRRKFGMIFQDHKLLYDRNCFENVVLPLEINDINPTDSARRVRAALNKVGLLNKEKVSPISLSGGEQQRLAIARAIVSRPSILIADEPTGNLDSKTSLEIMGLFETIHKNGNTIILVTHEEDIAKYAHRIVRLKDGLVENDQSNKDIRELKIVGSI
ncbi:MAG: cell division ATP-binding protein FtsE [Methylophilales bacterium]|nr:cell division ATP-binding protein FtsE [Methylophilales bacterium]